MIEFLTACWLGFVGACIGSFLNVVAYRWPRGMSVVWKPSHCPQCGHAIRARDNVPVLGWILLGGKCRDCGGAISSRYAIVEALVGALFFALAYVVLFTGGAYLPGGPYVLDPTAMNTVWSPSWPLLAWYAYQAAVFAALVVTVLIALDRGRFSPRTVAAIVLLTALVAGPYAAARLLG